MTGFIEAVLFDMGGTLRKTTLRDEAAKRQMVGRIIELIGGNTTADEFTRLLTARAEAYKLWSERTWIELKERDLWTRWMLPDWPADRIGPLAVQLNQTWREAMGMRAVMPETREVVVELFRRGYRLGLVSNTTSSVEIPQIFRELEISGCFETAVLSCVNGKRKPGPDILLDATRRMGVLPERCAYIGNRPERDVAAARRAGFAKTVIVRDPHASPPQHDDPALVPDHSIDNLKALFDIFPARGEVVRHTHPGGQSTPRPRETAVYDASLSTMWAEGNFPTLGDFLEASRRLGFSRIELNHKINSAILAGMDLKSCQLSSVHEPCPADIPAEILIKNDWLISAHADDNRRQGVQSIKRSIDLARELRARVVVVHAGNVHKDRTLEKRMRTLYAAGQVQSEQYQSIKENLEKDRKELAGPRWEAVIRSLKELIAYAGDAGVLLGLENRYHYLEFPSPDELGFLLELTGSEQLGFVYDVGHAQALDRLGFYPLEGWLEHYAKRILGVHLHDVIGIVDHYAPGLGEVDFGVVAAYLPADAFRTCELQAATTPEQVRAGLKILIESGCITKQ